MRTFFGGSLITRHRRTTLVVTSALAMVGAALAFAWIRSLYTVDILEARVGVRRSLTVSVRRGSVYLRWLYIEAESVAAKGPIVRLENSDISNTFPVEAVILERFVGIGWRSVTLRNEWDSRDPSVKHFRVQSGLLVRAPIWLLLLTDVVLIVVPLFLSFRRRRDQRRRGFAPLVQNR